jgi:hypothetical protein
MWKKILLTSIILLIIVCYLTTSWITITRKNYVVQWQHITALLLFIPLPVLLFKNYNVAVISTGVYLLLGIFRVLSLTAVIETGFIRVAGLNISGFNWLPLGLFMLYAILHLGILFEMQLDYKENRAKLEDRS